ncbi:MAG TPA: M48 family metalloprotease [Saprospiraceae bacterium]|nr:M48 family metalloprotease [Saprospiraceae bacterium]
MSIFQNSSGGGSRIGGTLILGLIMALFTLFQYYSKTEVNPITKEKQHIGISPEQEIAMGLQSAPAMAQEFGGLYPDERAQQLVKKVGQNVVKNSAAKKTPYQYDFHLLADPNVINAFALPGGQIFITYALFSQLETEDQLAGVLGHEIGHVVARHSAQRIADQQLTDGLTGAAVVATGSQSTAQMAQMIGNMINMKYGRGQELQSDDLGVRFMLEAGYEPEGLLGVMKIHEQSSGGQRVPEFQSTHPSPENRMGRIKEAMQKYRGLKNTKGDSDISQ